MAEPSSSDTLTLRGLVGLIVPASAEYSAPGADDPLIFADILATLARDKAAVAQLLRALGAPGLAEFARADIGAGIQRLAIAHGASTALLLNAIMQCYYRDARVMRALGMEPRPPFPLGFEVEAGDWTLLEPVRARARLWRDAP